MSQHTRESIVSDLIAYIRQETHITDDLGAESDLMELGLDSLDVMNYVFHIEETYGVTIPDELIGEEGFLVIGVTADHILANAAD